jgi:hypothetical protein
MNKNKDNPSSLRNDSKQKNKRNIASRFPGDFQPDIPLPSMSCLSSSASLNLFSYPIPSSLFEGKEDYYETVIGSILSIFKCLLDDRYALLKKNSKDFEYKGTDEELLLFERKNYGFCDGEVMNELPQRNVAISSHTATIQKENPNSRKNIGNDTNTSTRLEDISIDYVALMRNELRYPRISRVNITPPNGNSEERFRLKFFDFPFFIIKKKL